jgi:hypothetical protein
VKRFMLTAVTAAIALVGCQMQQTPTPTAANWQAPIAVAMGMAATGATTPDAVPATKVKRSQCTVCNGTGKVRSGDGIMVLDCDNCVPDGMSHELTPEEINALRDSLKHMAALERYQSETEAWKRDHMEAFVLASVAKRKAIQAQVEPSDKLSTSGLSYTDVQSCGVNGCTTTRTYSDGTVQTFTSSGSGGSCASGSCGSSSGARRGWFSRGLFGWRRSA